MASDISARTREAHANILQIVDALILYDTPMLDRRFQEAIERHPAAATREALATLPAIVARGSRLTRRAAVEWERVTGGGLVDDDFFLRSEHLLLEAFLHAAEAQIRLKSFMSRHAPTREVRENIDEAILLHRHTAEVLREAIRELEPGPQDEAMPGREARYLGEAPPDGDLRGCVEAAIRRMRAHGKEPRVLVLSDTGLRRLRDQGALQDRETRVLGVPVEVDFAWDAPKFTLRSSDSVTLEEMLDEQGAPP